MRSAWVAVGLVAAMLGVAAAQDASTPQEGTPAVRSGYADVEALFSHIRDLDAVLTAAGHLVHFEQPAAFKEVGLGFLKGRD